MLDNQLDIIDISANGSGVAKCDGKACFIPFSIDGEKVEANLVKQEKRYSLAQIKNIVLASPFRVQPVCPYFEKCGGCQLQHMRYDKQLDYKTHTISAELERAFGCKIDVNDCVASSKEISYRNKINLNIFDNKLCFLDANNNPIQINFCPLFSSEINAQIISNFNEYFASVSHRFSALHIRKIDGKYQFTLISSDFELKNAQFLINSLQKLKINFSIFVSKSFDKHSSNITDKIKCVYGEPTINYDIGGVKCQVSPAAFLQVNEQVQNRIYEDIAKMISSKSNVINAYGGTGVLAAILSKTAQKVFSIELNKAAARNCEKLLADNGIKNAESICGDCKIEIPKLIKQQPIDCVVVDPPRAGVEKSILEAIKKTDIQKLVYLSCNLQTLVRDLKVLQECYYIDSVQPYDMFPQTCHVETLVRLSRK